MTLAAQTLKIELSELQMAAHNKIVLDAEAVEERALAGKVQKLKDAQAASQSTPIDPADALRAQLLTTKCPREAGKIAAQLIALRS